ncbi:hypothetical protein Pmar_PMAR007140 [Perkinsus marinus ATCC 50983]|uniref:Uncharacterized protein n=1 Tax=Perkinsus marinus (strain ATCC 50983 / TXsc) TaxID=423536 RepID=C5KQB2_PERM5|nr:hypothetical protein Pmar_PMAR007140 [Perkinsus marinus ATCC 50983]EER13334.1 hypothetical protein Pmar_PMAR007140 [Perkinsus marinus ATCC 50983]|eukprot:XP_002781539.1 hypothetical protein Pmar_PMAR007140 [Perkinsus marinus ATCC 50983]
MCSSLGSPDVSKVDPSDLSKGERARLRAIFSADGQGLIRLTVGQLPGREGPLLVSLGLQARVLARYHAFLCHRPAKHTHRDGGTVLARWSGPVRVKGGGDSQQLVQIESLSGRSLGQVHIFNVKKANLSDQQLRLMKQLRAKDEEEEVTAVTANSISPIVVADLPPLMSTLFSHAHYVLGQDTDNKTPLVHVSLLEPSSTSSRPGFWVQTDRCDLWVQCPQYVFDKFKDSTFRCKDVGLNCRLLVN